MNVKSSIWFFLHYHRRNPLVARFARLCKNIHRATEHPGFDINLNGERAVLSRVLSGTESVVFDVGANIGDWTFAARDIQPTASIHSFELDPRTARFLSQRTAGQANIHVHDFGLSSTSGEVEFFSYPEEESVLSGLRTPLHSHVPHVVKKAIVQIGDEFCRSRGIEHIHYLKIDAEGADLDVLKGFREMLASHRISVIQFEHEGGHYLKEFYDLLKPKGYRIGKLYANYVDFRDHTAELEHFLSPNYIAILESQDALIRSLKKGW